MSITMRFPGVLLLLLVLTGVQTMWAAESAKVVPKGKMVLAWHAGLASR